MKFLITSIFMLLLVNNERIFAKENSEGFSIDTSKKLSIPADLVLSNNSEYLSNQSILFSDDNFQIIPINDFGNANFNLIKFDGIALNSLYDKSLDISVLANDNNLNYKNDFNNFSNNFKNNSKTSLILMGGSNIGNANLFVNGKIGNVDIESRNNYYVTNGFNNPKGVIFNPISEISKQSIQSSLNLTLSDTKTKISYKHFILSNFSKNNYATSENEFNDISNFNSLFVLDYLSHNSEYVTSNGNIFLKYSNRSTNLSNKSQNYKENELSYGINFGGFFKFIDEPTSFSLKYSRNNLGLNLDNDYNEYQTEDLIIDLSQKLSIYENNHTNIGFTVNILNPIDKLNKIQYNKSIDFGFLFDFHHFSITNGLINELYFNVLYENEMPAFKYLFASKINDESSIPEFNYQNQVSFGNRFKTEFLNFMANFQISYIRFNEYNFVDSIWLASNLNESWIMNIDFSLSYWKFKLEANYLLNLLGKEFRTDYRINNLPEMLVNLNLDFNVSSKTVISFFLRSYNFNYKNNLNEGFKGYAESSQLINLKIEQSISDSINLFLSINNILDEQFPIFPFYYTSGFSFLGGITIIL